MFNNFDSTALTEFKVHILLQIAYPCKNIADKLRTLSQNCHEKKWLPDQNILVSVSRSQQHFEIIWAENVLLFRASILLLAVLVYCYSRKCSTYRKVWLRFGRARDQSQGPV